MRDIYELTPSMRLLLTMHNISAVSTDSAKKIDDLRSFSDLQNDELREALRELLSHGYVVERDGTYYLSSLGISVVRSVYT
ncbi:MAG: hypothetical protein QXO54_05510 [Candidatus Methanomethylicaceae archaeon]|nr:hypothetical protein [Candidatus Verstraetearchaeota archaeon]